MLIPNQMPPAQHNAPIGVKQPEIANADEERQNGCGGREHQSQ